jgi:hypothetical protein
MVDLTKTQARARAVATAINREGVPCPTFTRASQNMAAAAALLHTLPTPSTNRVDKVYRQLKDILGIVAMQQAESSLQRRAEILISSLGHSKASRQKTTTEVPTIGIASLPTHVPTCFRSGYPHRRAEPLVHRQAHRGDEGAHFKHHACNPHHGGHNNREGHNLSPKGPGPMAFRATCMMHVS